MKINSASKIRNRIWCKQVCFPEGVYHDDDDDDEYDNFYGAITAHAVTRAPSQKTCRMSEI